MTREEALQWLTNEKWTNANNKYKKEWNEAFDMAIGALKALPSADFVPTVIRAKTFMRKEDFDKWAEDIKKQNKSIVCIPCDAEVVSADVAQGEWIWRTDISIGDGRTSAGYICSNCGKDYWHGNVFSYCPSCGARMKGGDAK